ncbi:chaplin [Streptomyces sp. NPDC052107]|uniref:chaplin n=1 Tax=Streptomyces sp. NPDC052107 TaxID=3155632 RepID=UPI00343EB52D
MGGSATAFAAGPDPTTGNASRAPVSSSGDVIQVRVQIPVNVCGGSISLIRLLNPATGSACVNR